MASPTSPKVDAADSKSPVSLPSPTSPQTANSTTTSPTSPSYKPTSPSHSSGGEAGAGGDAVPTSHTPASPSSTSAAATAAAAAAPAAPAAPAVPTAPAPHANPKIAELQTMFPTVDVAVIEMVLESVGGSQDRAIESLLQMTDPDFKPDELAAARQEESAQVDLDAEFARAIALQDEEEARQRRGSRSSRGPPAPSNASRLPEVLPYQPRVRKPRRPAPDPYAGEHNTALRMQADYDPANPPAGGQQGDLPPGLIAFEEKVTAMAETGRQTFNSFLNRAKAKYSEYQQQQVSATEQRARQQALHEAQMGEAYTEAPRQGGLWGETTGRTSLGSRSTSQSSQHSQDAPAPVPTRRWHPSDSYDDPIKPVTVTGRASPGAGASASPDRGTAAGKIDLAKLGLLPKKRVDLMSTSPTPREDKDPNPHLPTSGPSTPNTTKSLVDKIPKTPPAEQAHHTLGDSDDDDDLDYTENPFDRR